MPIQSTGTRSPDDRRRRRLAVGGDGSLLDDAYLGDGTGVASELVASSAAAPWVPHLEWRIWTYAGIVALLLSAVSFALAQPNLFRAELAPLTNHLLKGESPVLASVTQTLLWFLSAQCAILIAWYRSQCKLDFSGRYRVWPWAIATMMLFALCSATRVHVLLGSMIASVGWISWRAETVAWLAPACALSLPMLWLIDRDARRGQSTLYPLRFAALLGLISAGFELFAPELKSYSWLNAARLIVPLFAAASFLVAMWLHARIVAYVCPDPPEVEQKRLISSIASGWAYCAAGALAAVAFFTSIRLRWPMARAANIDEKPKRRTRKVAEDEAEEQTTKRKRKAPAKRTTKPKPKAKVVEDELDEEELIESEEEYEEETADSSNDDDASNAAASDSDAEWEEAEEEEEQEQDEEYEEEVEPPPPNNRKNRGTPAPVQQTSVPQNKKSTPPQQNQRYESDDEEEESDDSDDASYRLDDGIPADQLRGMSKRQKRELRQKLKDQQQRNRR